MSPAPKEKMRLRVVVVGAGIAGLACATGLRALDHDVLVLEQSRLKSEIGAAIHLGPNASKIALRWGMDLSRLSSPECSYYHEFNSTTGKAVIEQQVDVKKTFGAPWLLNHRVDLHNELKRLATTTDGNHTPPAAIQTTARVVAVDCENGVVTLEDGSEITGDVIIGADGIHSVVRKEVLGEVSIARPSGHSAYRCLIPADKVAADPELAFLVDRDGRGGAISVYVAEDRRIVLYPCRDFSLLNVVAILPDKHLGEASVESWSATGTIEELVEGFSEFAPVVKRLLSYAPSCGLWQLRDQDPLKTWVKGRVILVGDAAHSMLPHQGQGGGQSVEDAEALQVLLTGIDHTQVEARLKVVEAVRLERASMIQGYSRAKAMGVKSGDEILVNPFEFAQFNFGYEGALEWAKRHGIPLPDGL